MLSPLFKVADFEIEDYNSVPIKISYNVDKAEGEMKEMVLFKKATHFPIVKNLTFEKRKQPLCL